MSNIHSLSIDGLILRLRGSAEISTSRRTAIETAIRTSTAPVSCVFEFFFRWSVLLNT
jgi:hypothetical protein